MTRIAAATFVLAFAVACAGAPRRAEPPPRASAPPAAGPPPAPLAPPLESAVGTGPTGEPSATPLAVDREDDRPAPAVLEETFEWLVALPRLHGADAQRRASDLLANFSTLVRRLDPGGAAAEQARRIEEDARALATDPGWFGRTDRARSGLRASAAALERLAEARGTPELRPWIDAAAAAAEAIEAENPFGLERVALQDAFRAVADAFRAAVLRAGDRGARSASTGRSAAG